MVLTSKRSLVALPKIPRISILLGFQIQTVLNVSIWRNLRHVIHIILAAFVSWLIHFTRYNCARVAVVDSQLYWRMLRRSWESLVSPAPHWGWSARKEHSRINTLLKKFWDSWNETLTQFDICRSEYWHKQIIARSCSTTARNFLRGSIDKMF